MADAPDTEEPTRPEEYCDERDMDRFWEVAKLDREPFLQRWYIPSVLFLIVISIPWYRSGSETGTLILGMPLWIWVPLVCTLGLSILTSLAILRFWKDNGPGSE